MQQNVLLQEKIKTLKNKNDVIVDRQGVRTCFSGDGIIAFLIMK